MQEAASLWSPWIQYGFAGFSFVLLMLLFWLMKKFFSMADTHNDRLVQVIQNNNEVITGNSKALTAVTTTAERTREVIAEMNTRLLERPCLAGKDK